MQKAADEPIYTVTQLNREARLLLDRAFPALWVSGEISNLARPSSGHLYFSLKDEQAQVRCAMFRNAGRLLRIRPENGQQVLLRARISLYEARGEFQLIVEHMEAAGDGVLLRRLEELKKRLAAEGLFEQQHKKPLPEIPRSIGLITSLTGAAVRDILNILRRRCPSIPVIIYPVQVQGEPARHEISAALRTAADRQECDVLILARGGGSLEDLWAFNEEMVARAIFGCPLPVVTGIGHEVDFTLSDLVADLRAPTPSGAAELVAPDQRDLRLRIRSLERAASLAVKQSLGRERHRATTIEARLARTHPGYILSQRSQRLDELRSRLTAGTRRVVQSRRVQERHLLARLRAAAPRIGIQRRAEGVVALRQRLGNAALLGLTTTGGRLAVAVAALHAFSPLRTLERGYAIVSDTGTGQVLRHAGQLTVGQTVTARLAAGSFDATVRKIRD